MTALLFNEAAAAFEVESRYMVHGRHNSYKLYFASTIPVDTEIIIKGLPGARGVRYTQGSSTRVEESFQRAALYKCCDLIPGPPSAAQPEPKTAPARSAGPPPFTPAVQAEVDKMQAKASQRKRSSSGASMATPGRARSPAVSKIE